MKQQDIGGEALPTHEHDLAKPQWCLQTQGPPYLDPGIAAVSAPSIDGASVVQPGQVRSPLPCKERAQTQGCCCWPLVLPEVVRGPSTGCLRITLGFSSHTQGGRALARWASPVGRLQVLSAMLTWARMEEGLHYQGPSAAELGAGKHMNCVG